MRIRTNVAAMDAQNRLARSARSASDVRARLSSATRITRAADDAAGLARANRLHAEVRGLTVAARNIEQMNAVLSIAEGAATSIHDLLVRMKELTTAAASSNTDAVRHTVKAEHDSLREEIERVAGAAEYQGTQLINGDYSSRVVRVGPSGAAGDEIEITLPDLTLDGLDLDHFFSGLSDAAIHMGCLDEAMALVNEGLASIGATQNRLESAHRNVATAIRSLSASESTIRDADIAEEATALARHETLQKAGTAMLAQANGSTESVLTLLRSLGS